MRDSDLAHWERQSARRPRARTLAHRVARHPRIAPRSTALRFVLRCLWVALHPTRDIGPLWRESARVVCEPDAGQGAPVPRRPASVPPTRLLAVLLPLLLVQTD